MTDATTNRAWHLTARPEGSFDGSSVELREGSRPEPGEGQALIRVTHLSIDPTIRGWMSYDTYLPAIPLGDVVRSGGIGEVVESNSDRYAVGDLVTGLVGWQEWAIADEGAHRMGSLPSGVDPVAAVSLFGATGLAAYFGLLKIGQPEKGDVVLVSGAAGATGSVAGQIAKLKGCTVIGVAGGPEKCAMVVDEFGFDACLDYKADTFRKDVAAAVPDGIDIYFDNVGGDVLEAALSNLAMNARIVVCGAISGYDGAAPTGPRNYSNLIVKRAKMEGFLIFDHADENPQAYADLGRWADEGKIVNKVDLSQGIESVPDAFKKLFSGGNVGKNAVVL